MQASKEIKDFIKSYENFSAERYRCPAGKETIGYGHAINGGESFPDVITKEKAEEIFAKDIETAEKAVKAFVYAELPQNKFDPLVSLAYNLGWAGFGKCVKAIKAINYLDYDTARKEFFEDRNLASVTLRGGGRKWLSGLARRREAEKRIFETGIYPEIRL